MAEEINKTEESTEEIQEGEITTNLSAKDVRESKWFKSVQSEAQKYKAKLQEMEEHKAQQEDEKRNKELEEKGEYQRLIKESQERLAQLESEKEKMKVEFALKDQLRNHGVNHPILMKHAIGEFSGGVDEIETYVQTIVEDESNQIFFGGQSQQSAGQVPPVVKQPAPRGQEKSLDEKLGDHDLDAMNEKLKQMLGM